MIARVYLLDVHPYKVAEACPHRGRYQMRNFRPAQYLPLDNLNLSSITSILSQLRNPHNLRNHRNILRSVRLNFKHLLFTGSLRIPVRASRDSRLYILIDRSRSTSSHNLGSRRHNNNRSTSPSSINSSNINNIINRRNNTSIRSLEFARTRKKRMNGLRVNQL